MRKQHNLLKNIYNIIILSEINLNYRSLKVLTGKKSHAKFMTERSLVNSDENTQFLAIRLHAMRTLKKGADAIDIQHDTIH